MTSHSQATTLSEIEFINIVKTYHPIAQQAQFAVDMSEMEVLQARGNFDPILQGQTSVKELGNVAYYNYRIGDIKIPTWYGIEFNAGVEHVGGLRTDPQETIGPSSFAGISVPLLKNLVIDKRRAFLQQAKLMVNQTEAERKVILNNLLFDAISQYWEWVKNYQKLQIIDQVIEVNQQRLKFTKQTIQLGERPAIDSVEAITQLQAWQLTQNEIRREMQNALIQLSTYTWADKMQIYNLPLDLVPNIEKQNPLLQADEFNLESEWTETALKNHPALEMYQYKFKILDINQKLKFQELLPKLDFKYFQLGKNYNLSETLVQPLLQNNYQYGLSFAVPLRLSAGRAEYKMAKIKIKDANAGFDLKQRAIVNKVREYFNDIQVQKKQIKLLSSLLNNQASLFLGEEIRFNNGESSLFLMNSREQKKIETEQKLIESFAVYAKQKAGIKWAAGVLAN